MKVTAVIAVLLAFLVAAIAIAFAAWTSFEDVEISTGGLIALALGVVMTIALGGGLMFLVFYSSRKGYDDPDR